MSEKEEIKQDIERLEKLNEVDQLAINVINQKLHQLTRDKTMLENSIALRANEIRVMREQIQ